MVDTINMPSDQLSDVPLGPATSTSEELELLKRIDNMVLASREQRQVLMNRWIKALDYWRGAGGQWRHRKQNKVKGKQWTQAEINRTFPIIEQQISMMTDNNPKGIFLPEENSDAKFTKEVGQITSWRARRIGMRGKLIRSLHNCKLFGTQAMYVYWDDSLTGDPDVSVRLLDPRELIVDPDLQTTIPEDGEYIGYSRQVSLDYCKWRWQEKADLLDAEAQGHQEMFTQLEETASLDAELGHVPNASSYPGSQQDKHFRKGVLTALWYKDYTTKKEQVPTPLKELIMDGKVVLNELHQYVYVDSGELWTELNSPLVTIEVPAYPFGRCTLVFGRVILEDYPWGQRVSDRGDITIEHARWPIALGINQVIPHRWYGMDETEMLTGDQDVANNMASAIQDHCKTIIHPRMKYETGAIVDIDKVSNLPNARIPMNNGRLNGLEWDRPPDLGQDPYLLLELAERGMEQTSGVSGQQMGKMATRKATATEIATLDRAGRGRVGMASALFDEFVARVYELIAETIQRHYSLGRVVRITGEASAKDIAVRWGQGHQVVRFDVEVEPGSTMPFDKDKNKQDALTLNEVLSGSYLPEVLDAFEVKNKEEVLQRNQQWMLFMQYAEVLAIPEVQQYLNSFVMQMQAQQGGGGAPPNQ